LPFVKNDLQRREISTRAIPTTAGFVTVMRIYLEIDLDDLL
jgi:hypothetical protein